MTEFITIPKKPNQKIVATCATDDHARPGSSSDHTWQLAGQAWGRRAADWACLWEHYSAGAVGEIFDIVGLQRGTALLDMACGSGLVAQWADRRGAVVAGIDAAEPLIDIARQRTPHADLRVGNMFHLPWSDGEFDVVTAINGIWGGCQSAVAQAYRVLRPGGYMAITFWGSGRPLDLRECFKTFAANSPEEHLDGMRQTNKISRPGVAEEMLTTAGFEVVHRSGHISELEWADAEIAWRAMASAGPAVPALDHVGPVVLKPQVLAALEPCRDHTGIYRMRNDLQVVVARKPA